MSADVQSPVFVGRHEEMASLTALLGRARQGEPAVALIAGEAGVGKTRIVSELAAEAAASGFTVLSGHCIELGSEGLPLAPLVGALRALARSTPPEDLAGVLGPARRGLGRLLPELDPDGSASPGADAASQIASGAIGGVGGIQAAQLLELVLGVLGRLSARQPLMLVLEDLHWADQSTRDLVAFLIRSLRDIRVLLVATYRSDELNRRHPLRALVTSWERIRSVTHVELRRFDRHEVAAQLTAILGAEPAADLVDLVFDRSGGNAYLVEELAGMVRDGGDPAALPPSLRDVLLSRVDALSADAQLLLRIAAVAGRSVPDAMLARIAVRSAGVGNPEFSAGLREAVESHLLVVDHTGRGYAFRHALTRDAVYDDMLPGERGQLHAAYGETLAVQPGLAQDDGAVPAALAHHWYAALDLPRALPASIAAARQALASFAPAEAQHHLERALEIWPRVADAAERTGIDQAELARLAGEASYQAGDVGRSLSLIDHALAEMPAAKDATRHALLLDHRSHALRDTGREEEAIATLERALALLPADELTRAHAVVLASLAAALMRTSDMTTANEPAERAVRAARAVGAIQQEADASITLGLARCYQAGTADGLDDLRAGLALAVEHDVPWTALRGYVNLSDVLEMLGQHSEAADVTREGIALATRAGFARTLGSYLTGNLVDALLRIDRWSEAETCLAEALHAMPEGIFAATLLLLRAELGAMRGRYGEAAADLRAARQALGQSADVQFVMSAQYADALTTHGLGDLPRARQLAAVGLIADTSTRTARYAWPLLWIAMRIEADEAIAARDRHLDVPAFSVERRDEVAQFAATLAVRTASARGYQALVVAEQERAAGPGDGGAWAAAAQAWRLAGEPYPLAYTLLRLAEVQAAAGDREGAGHSARDAQAIAAGAGAAAIAADIAALARRSRLSLAEPEVIQDLRDPLSRFGLTDRERGVLELLAAGLSNPQIASALFISPKTASVHVSNILAKLGVAGRVEAAAVAHRLGVGG